MTMVAFVRARAEEKRDRALAAREGPWKAEAGVLYARAGADWEALGETWLPGQSGLIPPEYERDEATTAHILACAQPEQALAEAGANLAILHMYEVACEARDTAPPRLASMARAFAEALRRAVVELASADGDHPDYDINWRLQQ